MNWIEWIGWIATGMTILSFWVRGEFRIRVINGLACLVWISYGIFEKQNPIIVVNGIVLLMHLKFFYNELDNLDKINSANSRNK